MSGTGSATPGASGAPQARPSFVRLPVLWILSLVYSGLTALWRATYHLGWRRTERAFCPVISVGNLTAGGSGKTPVVDWLVRAVQSRSLRPVIISRGYRSKTKSSVVRVRIADGAAADPAALGDEPAMLALRNPELAVYGAPNRALAARLAAAWDQPDLIVLDDGFQHLRLARDLNLLLVDAQQGLGNERLLPLGPLREPMSSVRRADAVLISKANLGDAASLRERLREVLDDGIPLFTADYRPSRLRRLDGAMTAQPEALDEAKVGLICGIAQPAGFVRSVTALGAAVIAERTYPDHHDFSEGDCLELDAALMTAPAEYPGWLTTEKDAVKLTGRLKYPDRIWVLEMDVYPDAEAQAFFFDFIARCTVK